ncbi:MAG TPA: SDR family NAD(P)-dependent oxidoreductase [Microthrixaceae bacterium]|nr:SDR family NAD(P)-dependent oxidoreductase [Microthrixaceae bacterium]HNI34896.1 SDR family NAD(P)-dependent oxidoreductase [Microthrixaceae bacterium]
MKVLVLGGGSDIAAATVATLQRRQPVTAIAAARDTDVAINGLSMAAPGAELIGRRWDALDINHHDSFINDVFDRHGAIDLVLCAVGRLGHHAGMAMTPADVDSMVRANFSGPAAALSSVGRRMAKQRRGSIVVLSSIAGARARKSNYVYGSAKAGLDSFAQGLGDALVGHGVEVIVVRPGFVRSKMTTGLDPAPFSRSPGEVASAVVESLGGGSRIVWVPGHLGPMMSVLQLAPRSVWRRVAGDR